jgi:uncharacterized protein (TIGR02145 family)
LLLPGWRLPTYTEWYNADQNGGWHDFESAYAGVLKLHGAGYLDAQAGNVYYRGANGQYWSSTQNTPIDAWYLNTGSCYMNALDKEVGYSVRCLKDE